MASPQNLGSMLETMEKSADKVQDVEGITPMKLKKLTKWSKKDFESGSNA